MNQEMVKIISRWDTNAFSLTKLSKPTDKISVRFNKTSTSQSVKIAKYVRKLFNQTRFFAHFKLKSQTKHNFIPKKAKFPAPKRRTSRPKKVKKAKTIVEAEKSELLTVSTNNETTKVKKIRKSKKDRDSKKSKKSKTPKKEKKQIIEDESK